MLHQLQFQLQPKIKVNTKRASVKNVKPKQNETDEILVIEEQIEDEYKNESQKLVA